jgi:hypothetical protein
MSPVQIAIAIAVAAAGGAGAANIAITVTAPAVPACPVVRPDAAWQRFLHPDPPQTSGGPPAVLK